MKGLPPLALLAVVSGAVCFVPSSPAEEPGKLAFTASGKEFRFDTGVLQGTLRKDGRAIGLKPIVHPSTGAQVAILNSMGLLSPYRIFTPNHRFADGWSWASQANLGADGAVEVHWAADQKQPFEMNGVYRIAARNAFDFTVTIKPRVRLEKFELFMASYCQAPDAFVYVQGDAAGKKAAYFSPVMKADGIWQAFPRDTKTLEIIRDGRWKAEPHPVDWVVRPQLAAPLAYRRDPDSKLTTVLMSSPPDCFMVSSPHSGEPHRSLYFSLFGRDLPAGQEAQAGMRLVVDRDLSEQQILDLYNKYVDERR